MNLSMKKKHTHRENRPVVAKWVERQGRDRLLVWDWQMQTIIFRMDNNKLLLNNTGNYIQYPVINYRGKEYE